VARKTAAKTIKGGERPLSGAESDLWNQVMGGVEPLGDIGADFAPGQEPGQEPGNAPPENKPPAKQKKQPPQPGKAPPAQDRLSPRPKPAPTALTHGKAPGLDRRSETKMRRGQVDIEARIDLHGMTQDEAHRALSGFLRDGFSAGRRTVLAITGKGAAGEGVLRNAVPKWLNETANREMIRGFSHAAPRHGGAGALYILLKRQK